MLSTRLKEYLESTNEQKQALDPNFRKQYDFQIREKVKEALDDFNLLLSSHSEDQLKKIFSDESIDNLFKIQEKAIAVSDYPLVEGGYNLETTFVRDGRLFEYDEKKLERFFMHIDTEIDAIAHNQPERNFLKTAIRNPGDSLQDFAVLQELGKDHLKSEYDRKSITAEEYIKRREILDSKLKEMFLKRS